ncbi:MAG TPA: amino acid--[acyl-carrier-protein] ligase [Solirubrobacteraceae bacterium]
MAPVLQATTDQAAFLRDLQEAGLLVATGEPGVYGRGAAFEDVRLHVDALITRVGRPDGAEHLRFPPVIPRRHFEDSGYLKSFPHLAGSIFSFEGSEDEAQAQHDTACAHGDWSGFQHQTNLVLVPAACYPVYPAIAARGPVPAGGVTVDAGGSYVFRHEPSEDPARLQMFHQREMVRIGEPDTVAAWRDVWRERAVSTLRGLGLEARLDVASDPFFGRAGRLLARSQRAQALKFEVLVPIAGAEPTAVASFNYHQDHFAEAFGLEGEAGATVHTSCLGFGLERITLALLRAHGLDPAVWPADVRAELS